MSKAKIKYGLIPVVMVLGLLIAVKVGILPFGHAKSVVTAPNVVTVVASEVQYMSVAPKLLLTGSTTAAMVFGMLPLAIGVGPGAEGRAPMALCYHRRINRFYYAYLSCSTRGILSP